MQKEYLKSLKEINDFLTKLVNNLAEKKVPIPLQTAILVLRKNAEHRWLSNNDFKQIFSKLHDCIDDLEKQGVIDSHEVNMLRSKLVEFANFYEQSERIDKTSDFLRTLYEHVFLQGRLSFPHIERVVERFLENAQIVEFLRHKLSNRVLFDLGCAENGCSTYELAKLKLALKEYVGVDKYLVREESYTGENGYRETYIKSDMLLFLSKLPDNSANYLIAGIDMDVVSNHEYFRRMNAELLRTTEKNGIIIGGFLQDPLLEGFEIIFGGDYVNGVFVAVKK